MSSRLTHPAGQQRTHELHTLALAELPGAAMVLDDRLRVVAHTAQAERVVGTPLPVGAAAALRT